MSEQEDVEILYRTLEPLIYRACLRVLKQQEAARDATHDAFVKLIEVSGGRRTADVSRAWLLRVARNICLNQLRARKRGQEVGSKPSFNPAQQQDPDERELVQSILMRFSPPTQRIAIGVLVEELKCGEVAKLLRMSPRTVSRALARFLTDARKVLLRSDAMRGKAPKKQLSPFGGARCSHGCWHKPRKEPCP